MSTHAVALGGIALHAGVSTSVVFSKHSGGSLVEQAQVECPLFDLQIVRADRGVTVENATSTIRVDLVEHVLAAVGALRLETGLRIRVHGPELPLLDGGARRFATALRGMGLSRAPLVRRIVRPFRVQVGTSAYEFAPSQSVRLSVQTEFDHVLASEGSAAWEGDECDFIDRIAPSRTFGFLSEGAALRATARALGANSRDVVVLCEDGTTITSPPPAPDECARHKLLDLIGDLTLCGGLPLGIVHGVRPGHRATHEAVRRASKAGIFGRCG